MIKISKISKYVSGLLLLGIISGCAQPGNVAPIVPTREYISPTYTPDSTDFTASLPPGTTPTDIKMSGLSDKELEKGQVLVPVGKVQQFLVDVKLNTNQILKSYYAVKWSVVNPEIGTINAKGVFSPIKEGTTKVIASIGGVATTIEVTVSSALNIWTQVVSPTTKDLYSVKMVNDNEAWAVGQGGTVLHFFNGGWTDESPRVPTGGVDLTGIDATDTGEVWVVGGSVLLHYNGSTWEKSSFTPDGNVKAVDIINQNDGWAVGSTSNGKGLVLHYVNGNWQNVESGISEELNSVSALGSGEVWVAGKSRFLGSPAIFKLDGNNWKKARFNEDTILKNLVAAVQPWDGTYEVKSIKMLNGSQGWAVGEYSPVGSTIRGNRGFMMYYDSIKDVWTKGTFDKATPDLNQVPLKNVGMISGGKGWVLGTNTPPKKLFSKEVADIPGSFLSSNGKELKVDTQYQANTVGKSFYGIDILPNGNGIVVGESGFIMHHQYDISRPNYYNNSSNYNNYNNYAGSGNSGGYSGSTGTYGY